MAGKAKPELPVDMDDKEAIKAAERYRLIERRYLGFIRGGALLSDDKKEAFHRDRDGAFADLAQV
ncbi:MAG: hypothetical protein LRZ88_11540 [Candidatus Cloacimonetes bacterium]|nr:hypothetical protein [Candidatus Cloacimonadota bacterium]